ncbi:hypothetical protein LTR95_003018 [Oleoguttula sp. CCFEE 5521]
MAAMPSISPPRLELLQGDNDPCILVLEKRIGSKYPDRVFVVTIRGEGFLSATYDDHHNPTNAEKIKACLRSIVRNYPVITYRTADINQALGNRRGTVKGTDISTQQLWFSEVVKRKGKETMPAGVERAMIHLETSFHPGSSLKRDLWEDARNVLILYEAARERFEGQGSSVSGELQRLRDVETRRRYEQSRRDRAAHDEMIKTAAEAQAIVWKLEIEIAAREAKALEAQRAIEVENALEAEGAIREANMAHDLASEMEKYAALLQEQSKTATTDAVPEQKEARSVSLVPETKTVTVAAGAKQLSTKTVVADTKLKANDAFASCLAHFGKKNAIQA